MAIKIIGNLQSKIVSEKIKEAVDKIDFKIQISALDNILFSLGLNDRHTKEVKQKLVNKLGELIIELRRKT